MTLSPTIRSFLWQHGVSLALVLMLAVALRLPATQRGFFCWDDAQSRQALARIFADPRSTQIRIYDLRKLLDGRFGGDATAASGGQ